MGTTDSQVIRDSQADDPAAFMELFWLHGPSVHAYLSRRVGRQEADDLLGEVWMRAFKDRSNYDDRCSDSRPWLYGIARNVLRAHWRHASKRRTNSASERVASAPWTDDGIWTDTDSRLDASAQHDALHQALAKLSEGDRDVLLLVVWEQLTPAEAAVALKIPQGTARSRLHRALSILRSEARPTMAPITPITTPRQV